ncbi:MAG TPA: NifB/NifX family molybdenum-iron cluster-binding protein [Methanobacterium sp.]|nr:NifB/NifX family molybdenum-iron cluster-binding protein [Methanobacterium sp.]
MKIAVASTNGKTIDLHFGDAKHFLVYEMDDENGKFMEIREKTDLSLENHTERWVASIDLIDDCKAVLCRKIGKEPIIVLRKMGIKPMELDCQVEDALKECSNHLLS